MKYKTSIEKNPAAKLKWQRAMRRSQTAVPDIDDFFRAVDDTERERYMLPGDQIMGRRVLKAVSSMNEAREHLHRDACALLERVQNDSSDGPAVIGLRAALNSRIYPVVETFGCTDRVQVGALVLAAYIISRSVGHGMMGIDGHLICLPPFPKGPPERSSVTRKSKSAGVSDAEVAAAMEWVDYYINGQNPANQPRAANGVVDQSLREVAGAIQKAHSGTAACADEADLILLCRELPTDCSSLTAVVADLTNSSSAANAAGAAGSNSFRTIMVHKLKASILQEAFKLRAIQNLPSKSDLIVDVAFLMDFTASMGSWMREAKNHIVEIARSLNREIGGRDVRMAFVGYRDYQDDGRVVCKQFVSANNTEEVVSAILNEGPSGGGDEPEDVLSGMMAVRDLDWKGHLRICLHVCDAPPHGYCSSIDYCHDNYPSGFCPDQNNLPNLKQVTTELAMARNVDMVLCECNSSRTVDLRRLYESVYALGNGLGFGVVPLERADSFKDTITSVVGSAVLSLLVSDDVAGLQSFSGNTLSSVISTVTSSTRESLFTVSHQLREVDCAEIAQKNDFNSGSYEPDECSSLSRETSDGMDYDSSTPAAGDSSAAAACGVFSAVQNHVKGRTDYERLMYDLESLSLHPVRLVLGMPLNKSLALQAGQTLIEAGLSVNELRSLGYPPAIIDVFVEAAAAALQRL